MRHVFAAIFVVLGLSTADATESPSVYLPMCAELDLAAISDMETAANEGQLPAAKIAAAFFEVMNARKICAAGRVSDALAIYDAILDE
jgi:hypothetical protein